MNAAKASAPATAAAPLEPTTLTVAPLAGAATAALELKLAPTMALEQAFSPKSARTSAAVLIRGILAAGTLEAITDRGPFRRLGRRLDQDFVAPSAIELA